MDIFKLYKRFVISRQRLINLATDYGLDDPRVLAQSQKVDRLIMELIQLQKGVMPGK